MDLVHQKPGRAVFVDRDGTINVDPGYLSNPDQMALIPGVGPALAALQKVGFLLVVVSNQSGVGRGLIRPDALSLIHARMECLLAIDGVKVDRYSLCLHRPEDECECRKPKPFLIHQAAKELGVLVSSSYMVGDKISDLEAGRAAGCAASLLVRTGDGINAEKKLSPKDSGFVVNSLVEAAQWILARETSNP